ncbi:MAG: hypothetical protein HZA34_03825 [Candidatus Pacebacteria bacterium]|nr:hypothetical protein [Candidatus Paceibacterota bacterium]
MTKISGKDQAYNFDPSEEGEEERKKDKEKFSIDTPSGRKNFAGNMLGFEFISVEQYDRLVGAKDAEEFRKLCKEFDVVI